MKIAVDYDNLRDVLVLLTKGGVELRESMALIGFNRATKKPHPINDLVDEFNKLSNEGKIMPCVGFLFNNEQGQIIHSISNAPIEGYTLIGPVYSEQMLVPFKAE